MSESQIHACMEDLARALRAKDVDAVMTHYAPDMIVFDVRPPLQKRGADAYRANFEAWFAMVRGPIDYRLDDVVVATGTDLAYFHGLGHVQATTTNGATLDYWVRVTSCLRKIEGRWLITHEHVSMPLGAQP